MSMRAAFLLEPTPRLRALVVEDEWPTRNYLVELIEATRLAEVVGAVAGVDEALEVLRASAEPIDVVFVDIDLQGGAGAGGGLDVVRAIAGAPGEPMLVLATAYRQHALEAFDLGVDDYLLKPFGEERVRQSLQRLLERRPIVSAERSSRRVVARRKKSLVFLEPTEIWAFEAADRLTYVHSQHGKFDVDLSLAAIEASFGSAFLRVHRNWLVNVSQVRELDRGGGDTTLFVGLGIGDQSQGIRVPVSRERSQSLRQMLLARAAGLRQK